MIEWICSLRVRTTKYGDVHTTAKQTIIFESKLTKFLILYR